jgi:Helix-turn-helix domain
MKKRKLIRRKHTANIADADNPRLEPLLTPWEAAAALRCSRTTLVHWRTTGKGPRFLRLGRHIRYRPADLEIFIASITRRSTAEPKFGESAP